MATDNGKAKRDPMTPERWGQISGYPDYEVSSHGRVRSFKNNKDEARQLKATLTTQNILIVSLVNEDGKKTHQVRDLVTRVFLGDRLPGQKIFHHDNDTTNCSLYNLEYTCDASNKTINR